MNISKDKVLGLLRRDGNADWAEQAQTQLPDQIDTDKPEHQNLLQKVGLNPGDLISKLTGDNDGGDLDGALGKLLWPDLRHHPRHPPGVSPRTTSTTPLHRPPPDPGDTPRE